jgi:hypothetical protein
MQTAGGACHYTEKSTTDFGNIHWTSVMKLVTIILLEHGIVGDVSEQHCRQKEVLSLGTKHCWKAVETA